MPCFHVWSPWAVRLPSSNYGLGQVKHRRHKCKQKPGWLEAESSKQRVLLPILASSCVVCSTIFLFFVFLIPCECHTSALGGNKYQNIEWHLIKDDTRFISLFPSLPIFFFIRTCEAVKRPFSTWILTRREWLPGQRKTHRKTGLLTTPQPDFACLTTSLTWHPQ